MDYFPVTITEFPKDPSSGDMFTPDEFFNFVRTNLNDFIGDLPLATSAFEGADALWSAFQDNIVSFVNNPLNGGQGQKQDSIINRPDWDDIKDVLNGDKPISILGCN